MLSLTPLTFSPVFKDYIWGGRNLERVLGCELPPGIIAESWEIAAHPDGDAVVDSGIFAGLRLTEVHARLGLDLIGRTNAWAQKRGKFPLLVKLLDANRPLSVQVHPDDDYARAHEKNELGKAEMWVVLDAKPGAELILGVRRGTTPEMFRQAIADGKLEPYLHHLPIQTGDVVCVPARTLHAILGGVVIAEIQQNSNTTYRVYDWNRPGADGRPRPLHIEKALDVIDFNRVEPGTLTPELRSDEDGIRRERLCSNRYFTTERFHIAAGAVYRGRCDGETLEIWGTISGNAEINGVELPAVRFTLLPAALGAFTLRVREDTVLLRTYVESN